MVHSMCKKKHVHSFSAYMPSYKKMPADTAALCVDVPLGKERKYIKNGLLFIKFGQEKFPHKVTVKFKFRTY